MIVVAVLNATYFAHKDLFGVWNCSVVLRYKGQDSIIFFSLLEEDLFTSFKFRFREWAVDKKFG